MGTLENSWDITNWEMQVQHWHLTLHNHCHTPAMHTATLSHSWVFPRKTDSIFWLSFICHSVYYSISSPCWQRTVSALLCATEGSSSQNQQQFVPQLLEATSLIGAKGEKMGLKKASPQSAAASCPAPSTQHTCNSALSSFFINYLLLKAV